LKKKMKLFLRIIVCILAAMFLAVLFLIMYAKINVLSFIYKRDDTKPDFNVVYKSIDGIDLHFDVYYPKRQFFTRSPVVFYFHGGSWNSGSKNLGDEDVLNGVLEYGLTVVSVEYRLTNENTVYPAFLDDCADAIRFVTLNAKTYGIDKDRICVFGASAGGQISLIMSLKGSEYGSDALLEKIPVDVKCCVALCAPSDFLNLDVYNDEEDRQHAAALLKGMFGGTSKEKYEAYKDASPVYHVYKGAPPIFLSHGTDDEIVPFEQAEIFNNAAIDEGMDIWFYPIKKANHKFKTLDGGDTDPSVEWLFDELKRFLLRNLIL